MYSMCFPLVVNKAQCIRVLRQNDDSYSRECAVEIDTENKLLNKVIILDFLKLQEYFLCTKKTKLNRLSHMDYFNDVLTTFLGLECVSCVAVYGGQKAR